MGRSLGVDFGKRRTGLAISDTAGLVAVPLDEVIYETDPARLAIPSVEGGQGRPCCAAFLQRWGKLL